MLIYSFRTFLANIALVITHPPVSAPESAHSSSAEFSISGQSDCNFTYFPLFSCALRPRALPQMNANELLKPRNDKGDAHAANSDWTPKSLCDLVRQSVCVTTVHSVQ